MKGIQSIIVATGSYIPGVKVNNTDFLTHRFLEKDGSDMERDNSTIIEKFKSITDIEERRYAELEQKASDLGYLSAKEALDSSGIDKETLDYIIVAHNFGDIIPESNRVNLVPSLGSRIKFLLQIKNPDCVAYDIAFGCPGWVEGFIQANYYIQSGDAKRCLIIGTETLSRIIDPHDRDSMLYADGSGAVILEGRKDAEGGLLAHKTQTHSIDHAMLLTMNSSYDAEHLNSDDLFLKMNGRKLYEFALNQVPLVMKAAIDKAGLNITDIDKVLIHQANGKMDKVILQRLFELYDEKNIPENIMPMTISWLGNSSVATIPTLIDLIRKGKISNQQINPGDKAIIASVGAGMNINAVVYQF